jgi:arylamine N-acetyltransferase
MTPDLRDRVTEGFGFSSHPSPDLEGLRALYRAWCYNVPFDNVRKMIALRNSELGPLPGGTAEDFFEGWLEDGAGGTCWSTSNALFELVDALGFDARRVVGSMRDMGAPNHGTVRVRCDGVDWLIDSSMLTIHPLPLGDEIYIHDDAIAPVEVEPVDGTHLLWFSLPSSNTTIPCRLFDEPADHAGYLASYEASRNRGPFNQRLYVRRNRPEELVVLVGNTRFSKTAEGVHQRELSREELCQALRIDVGLSEGLIQRWIESGGLDASFEAAVEAPLPPITELPPSQRPSA